MALITGAVNVTGTLAPTDTNDVYATHDSVYGKGGYREVTDLLARNAITFARRSDGMLVYVQSEDKIYKLENGLENSNWVEFKIDSAAVKYDNTYTGLSAENVQDAVDEIATDVHTFKTKTVNYNLTGGVSGNITVTQGENVTISTVVDYAENDFAIGPTQTTSQPHSFVTGTYNIAKDSSIVEVGIGTDEQNKQNAFEISESGVVSAPAMENEMITQDGNLTTKRYIDYLIIDCGNYDT